MSKVQADWTAERVMQEQERWEQAQPETAGIPSDPVSQWDGLHRLTHAQKRFDDGDQTAAMDAIYICSMRDLPIPAWAAKAFISGYQKILHCRVASWDDAFGPPFRKNFKPHDARKRREQWPRVVMAVTAAILDEGMPVDAGLFEEVGQRLGIGARQVREIWYSGYGALSRAQVKTVKSRRAAATQRASRTKKTSR